MYLTVHTTAGLAIGASLTNPVGAFFIGLLSHYILDAIPHGDEHIKDTSIPAMAKMALADHIGVALNLYLLWLIAPGPLFTTAAIAAAVGAILPDWLMGIYRLGRADKFAGGQMIAKVIAPLEKFHHYCHFDIIAYELPLYAGFVLQSLTWAMLCVILINMI